jgi:dGTPase
VMVEAECLVADLFSRYTRRPEDLPPEWQSASDGEAASAADQARRIGNFIAGMTDRFAITEHIRLFDSTPELR